MRSCFSFVTTSTFNELDRCSPVQPQVISRRRLSTNLCAGLNCTPVSQSRYRSSFDRFPVHKDARLGSSDSRIKETRLEFVSFQDHDTPLYRQHSRASQQFRFWLWSHSMVKHTATGLLRVFLPSGCVAIDGTVKSSKCETLAYSRVGRIESIKRIY